MLLNPRNFPTSDMQGNLCCFSIARNSSHHLLLIGGCVINCPNKLVTWTSKFCVVKTGLMLFGLRICFHYLVLYSQALFYYFLAELHSLTGNQRSLVLAFISYQIHHASTPNGHIFKNNKIALCGFLEIHNKIAECGIGMTVQSIVV